MTSLQSLGAVAVNSTVCPMYAYYTVDCTRIARDKKKTKKQRTASDRTVVPALTAVVVRASEVSTVILDPRKSVQIHKEQGVENQKKK